MKKLTIAFVFLFLSLIFFSGADSATADILVTPTTAVFNVTNAAPGGEYESDLVTVTNNGPNAEQVQFSVDVTTSSANLAQLLYMKVVDEPGTTCFANCDFPQKLDSTTEIMLGPIGAGDTKKYKFIILFDKAADNEFQNAQMIFDLTIGYKGSIVAVVNNDGDGDGGNGGGGNGGNNNAAGVTGGGVSLVSALAGVLGTVAGEETSPQINGGTSGVSPEFGEVLGETAEEAACPAVPWSTFFFILVAYLFLINLNFWHKFNGQPKPRWFWEVVLTVLALVGWYYLDTCRTNKWFVYAVIISGFICYLIYLHYFKKKLKDGKIPSAE